MTLNPAQRINVRFALALMLVAFTGIVAFTTTVRLSEVSSETERSHAVLTLTERIERDLLEAESAQRGFLLSGDSVYLAPYQRASGRISGGVAQLRELLADDAAQQQRLSRIGPLAQRRLAIMAAVIEARARAGFDSAVSLGRSARGRVVMDSIRLTGTALQFAEQRRLEAAARRVQQTTRMAQVTVGIGSLLAFLIVIAGVLAGRREFSVRLRAEAALRESETLLKQFMDTLPIGAFVVDSDGRASFANTTALTMLGREAIDRGHEHLDLWRTGSAEPLSLEESPMTQALRGLAARADDLEIRVGGRTLPVEISAAPVFDSEGRVAYGIAAFSDITERKRSQAALRAAKDSAEQANQAKSDFLARMSHELRTPLNSIIGFANILAKKSTTLQEKERTYLERIGDNGKHLLLLINDILDLSKIEAGKVVIEKELVDLAAVIDEVLHQWDGQLRSGVRLESSIEPDTPPVFTDRARLRQIVVNLVSNAVKFTEHGSIRVVVEHGEHSLRPLRIRVTDTGIGIPNERLAAIFDAFEQAETSTARKYGGTGLGLPISRALCELLGYELDVASRVGEGTTFTIHLAKPRPAVKPAGDAAGEASPPLILIIDEHEPSRTQLCQQVEDLGYRVVAAFSAEQGLHLARALRPQLITLDVMLSRPSTADVLRQLKADPGLAGVPAVLVGSLAEAGSAALLGAVDVLEKPATRAQLHAVLRRILHRSGGRVLVVEDDEDTRELLLRILQDQVEEIQLAEHGEAALALLRDGFDPDLIVLDLMMPVLDGFALLDLVRGDPRLQHVPVVVVTGRDLAPREHEHLRAAAATLVKKGAGLERDVRHALAMHLPTRER